MEQSAFRRPAHLETLIVNNDHKKEDLGRTEGSVHEDFPHVFVVALIPCGC